MPGSKLHSVAPKRKRTASSEPKDLTKAVQRETMPKAVVAKGKNQPGPTTLHARFEGISNAIWIKVSQHAD